MMTGAPLRFEQVTGAQARAHGLGDADPESDYIEVHLARPVPADGGQARLRIVKTYKDAEELLLAGRRASCSTARSASGATPSSCRPATS